MTAGDAETQSDTGFPEYTECSRYKALRPEKPAPGGPDGHQGVAQTEAPGRAERVPHGIEAELNLLSETLKARALGTARCQPRGNGHLACFRPSGADSRANPTALAALLPHRGAGPLAIGRQLAAEDPDTHAPTLTLRLNEYSRELSWPDQAEAALALAEEALAVIWPLFQARPVDFHRYVALVLEGLLDTHQMCGSKPQGKVLERIDTFKAMGFPL